MTDPNIKYLGYIRNTGRVPLPIEMFDDDWEPIGPMLRKNLIASGLIMEEQGFLALREAAIRILEKSDDP